MALAALQHAIIVELRLGVARAYVYAAAPHLRASYDSNDSPWSATIRTVQEYIPRVGGGLIVSSRSTCKSFTESRDTGQGTMRVGAAFRQSRPSAVAGDAHIDRPVVGLEPNRLRHYPTAARSRHESTCALNSLHNAEPRLYSPRNKTLPNNTAKEQPCPLLPA